MAEDKNADPKPEGTQAKRKRLLDTDVFTTGTVRLFTDWTPQRIRAAERMAEQGDLYQAVSICDWLLTDDRISSAMDARLDALFGLVPNFEEGAGKRAAEVLKALS